MCGCEGVISPQIIYSALCYNLVITVVQIKDHKSSLGENIEFGLEDQVFKEQRVLKESKEMCSKRLTRIRKARRKKNKKYVPIGLLDECGRCTEYERGHREK